MNQYFKIFPVDPDGNCFFYSVSYCLYNTIQKYNEIKEAVYTELRTFNTEYEPFFDPDESEFSNFTDYIESTLEDGTWADNLIIKSAVESYRLTITIFHISFLKHREKYFESDNASRFTIVNTNKLSDDNINIYLLYDGVHYTPLIHINKSEIETEIESSLFALDKFMKFKLFQYNQIQDSKRRDQVIFEIKNYIDDHNISLKYM